MTETVNRLPNENWWWVQRGRIALVERHSTDYYLLYPYALLNMSLVNKSIYIVLNEVCKVHMRQILIQINVSDLFIVCLAITQICKCKIIIKFEITVWFCYLYKLNFWFKCFEICCEFVTIISSVILWVLLNTWCNMLIYLVYMARGLLNWDEEPNGRPSIPLKKP